MSRLFLTSIVISLIFSGFSVTAADDTKSTVKSKIEKTKSGDVFVIQEVIIPASVDRVWTAYTTTEGWKGWVAPVAEVKLELGGKIRTNYRKDAKLSDKDSNSLTIVNYVPKRILTLQADLNERWPEILRKDQKRMYNVITFEAVSDQKTRLVSYGIGYKDTPEYNQMLKFFVPANEKTYLKLIEYLKATK